MSSSNNGFEPVPNNRPNSTGNNGFVSAFDPQVFAQGYSQGFVNGYLLGFAKAGELQKSHVNSGHQEATTTQSNEFSSNGSQPQSGYKENIFPPETFPSGNGSGLVTIGTGGSGTVEINPLARPIPASGVVEVVASGEVEISS